MQHKSVRLSKWTHVFVHHGNYALFNSLLLSLVYLEERFLNFINELRWGVSVDKLSNLDPDASAIIDELTRLGLVVPTDYDDNLLLKEKQEFYIRPPSLETLYLLVTDSCNLACRYCLINCNMPEKYHHSTMSWSTAKEAVDMYFANLQKTSFKKTIVFYGGEPLLNFPVIRQVVEYVKSTYQNQQQEYGVLFTIITNGVLINTEVAKFLAQHTDIAVAISLDGNKVVNDQKRVFANGLGTFDQIKSGIVTLKAAGRDDVCISATIDEHNIDRMREILNLHKELSFAAVSFNLLLDTKEKVIDPAYTKKATDNLLLYFEEARKLGLYEDRIMRKVKAISKGVLHPHDCQATGEQLVCSPNGKLGVCHEGLGCRNFFFGEVSRDFKFSTHELICEWKKRSPLMMPQCYNCPALGICGGGCAYSAFLRHGTIWAVDDKFCGHSLAILDWIIWDIFSRM